MKKLKENLVIIIESLPLFTSIIFSTYVIYRHTITPFPIETLATFIIIILGTMAIGELIQSYIKLNSIHKKISSLTNLSDAIMNGKISNYFLRSRSDFIPFSQRVEGARKIYILGISCEAMITYQSSILIDKLKDSCEVRFILLDPQSKAVEARSVGLFSATKPEILRNDINRTLEQLCELKKQKNKGSLKIRLTNYIPSYGIVIIDPDKNKGLIIVELYPFLTRYCDRPHFELKKTDGKWYDYFLNQYNSLWDASSDYLNKVKSK